MHHAYIFAQPTVPVFCMLSAAEAAQDQQRRPIFNGEKPGRTAAGEGRVKE